MKKTDVLTVDQLLHLTLLRRALETNDEELFNNLHSPDYELVNGVYDFVLEEEVELEEEN